ncbi:Aminomethyltransferase [bacterium HR23]|nr:Aminomethyltransferase [bacterium HR23]
MASRSPLYSLHASSGASFALADGWEVPSTWTSPLQEAHTARHACALWDRSPWGRFQATGKDALDLLNRLSTNRLDDLPPSRGRQTVLTTNKGRCLDWLWVFRLSSGLLLLTSPGAEEAVASWIDTYTILEDASLTSLTTTTALIGVVGPGAEGTLGEVVGLPQGMGRGDAWEGHWEGTPLIALRTDALALPQWDLLAPAPHAPRLWSALRQRGALPLGESAVEVLRVAAGIPRRGKEITDAYNPLEAGLWESVSFNKGCYIGQEVLARLKTYGKIQKALARLAFPRPVPASTPLWAEGKRVGVVTSSAVDEDGPIALGYLDRPFLEADREVEAVLPAGAPVPGRVVWAPSLPPAYQAPPGAGEDEDSP